MDFYSIPSYVITCEQDTDRQKITQKRLEEQNMKFEWFPASDATHISKEEFEKEHIYIPYEDDKGSCGVALSHIRLWRKMVDEDIPRMFVFEDDIVFHERFKEIMPTFWDKTPKENSMTFMGYCCFWGRSSQDIVEYMPLAIHAYYITKNVAQWFLDNLGDVHEHIDLHMKKLYDNKPRDWKCYLWWDGINRSPLNGQTKLGVCFNGLIFQDHNLKNAITRESTEKSIKKATILGERCSGTNFLESALVRNFDIGITWEYGWKHFFGFSDYKDSDDTLFIGIVRDPCDWINSFYKIKWHLQPELKTSSVEDFMNKEFWSLNDGQWHHMLPKVGCCTKKRGAEIMEDRNIFTGERYANIFEARSVKCEFLLDKMSSKVKNFALFRYEDLKDNYEIILDEIKDKYNLKTKSGFPIPIKGHKGGNELFKEEDKKHEISPEQVWNHPSLNKEIEKRLGYSPK